MAISQTITPITPLTDFLTENKVAEVNNLVETELPRLSVELQESVEQINSTQEQMNTSASSASQSLLSTLSALATTQGYRDTAKTYRDTALIYQTGAQIAFASTQTLVNSLIIPVAATYTYEEVDNNFVNELDNFLEINLGE